MAKRVSPFERKLARLRELRAQAPPGAATELRVLLADREPYLAGLAAEIVAELGLRDFAPDLASALLRAIAGEQPDGGCMASEKIARALVLLEADEPDVLRAGLTYVRMEGSVEGPVDVAVPVRVECATALARLGARHALLDLTPLLCDRQPAVREGVARAIALLPGEGSAAVLQLKVVRGDDPDVLGACMSGLLKWDAERFLPLVGSRLANPAVAEITAIVLGESRLPGALALLRDALEQTPSEKVTRAILLALALLRLPEATEVLFEVLEKAPEGVAVHALGPLAVQRDVAAVKKRARAAVARRRSPRRAAALGRGVAG